MKIVASLVVATLSSISSDVFAQADSTWPHINSVDVSVGLAWQAERLYLDVPLLDGAGTIRYRLVCRGGADSYLDRISDHFKINYVGPLMCILNDGDKEAEASLLRESAVPPWFTRGQFRTSELVGACAKLPEFGRLRHFRLRGFLLTLEVADAIFEDGNLAYVTFHVSVRPDATAVTATAAPPGVPDPRPPHGAC